MRRRARSLWAAGLLLFLLETHSPVRQQQLGAFPVRSRCWIGAAAAAVPDTQQQPSQLCPACVDWSILEVVPASSVNTSALNGTSIAVYNASVGLLAVPFSLTGFSARAIGERWTAGQRVAVAGWQPRGEPKPVLYVNDVAELLSIASGIVARGTCGAVRHSRWMIPK